MASADDLLIEAAQFQGYLECREPTHSSRFPTCSGGRNHTRFHDEVGLPSGPDWPWCLIFWQAIAKRVGLKLPMSASTRQLWQWALDGQHGLQVVPASQARRGDFVMFDFPGGHTPTDHIEGLLEVIRPGVYRTLGANTSPDDGGSQSNGGGVFPRTRSAHVRGFIRPPFSAVSTPASPPQEDDMRPVILAAGGPLWLVLATGSGLVRVQMADGADTRNYPEGYGPIVETTVADLDRIPVARNT